MRCHLPFDQYTHLYLDAGNLIPIFGDSGEDSARAYHYFLGQYAATLGEFCETFAYCLLPTHFHLFFRTYSLEEQIKKWYRNDQDNTQFVATDCAQLCSQFLQTCLPTQISARAVHCVPVRDEVNFAPLVRYIHQNPALHGVSDNFREWHWSSYKAILGAGKTQISAETVLNWFYGHEWFDELHWEAVEQAKIGYLILGD